MKAVQTLHSGCTSSVKLAHGASQRFDIGRGIKQGCPISPFVFLLVTQIMDTVTYLGIVICKDEKQSCENFNSIIEKTKNILNLWLMRDISLYHRVLLAKAEGLSRSVYVSLSLELSPKTVKDLDKILYNFIWRNKPHYLRKDILTNTQEQGGLEVLDFNTLNNTFKINWILKYIKNQNSIWNVLPLVFI